MREIQVRISCSRTTCQAKEVVWAPAIESQVMLDKDYSGVRVAIDPTDVPDPPNWSRSRYHYQLLCPKCAGEEQATYESEKALRRRKHP